MAAKGSGSGQNIENIGDLQTRVRVLEDKLQAVQRSIPDPPDEFLSAALSFFGGE